MIYSIIKYKTIQGWYHTDLELQQEQLPSFHQVVARSRSTFYGFNLIMTHYQNPYGEYESFTSSLSSLRGEGQWAILAVISRFSI